MQKLGVGPVLLTICEEDVLRLIAEGCSAKEVARRIDVSPRTVEKHIDNIRAKMGARNTARVVFQAHR